MCYFLKLTVSANIFCIGSVAATAGFNATVEAAIFLRRLVLISAPAAERRNNEDWASMVNVFWGYKKINKYKIIKSCNKSREWNLQRLLQQQTVDSVLT